KEYKISQNDEPIYRIDIDDQIRINSLYKIINESSTDPIFPPTLFSYYNQNEDEDFPLIKRNFGAINELITPNRIPSEVKTLRLDGNYTFAQVLKKMSSIRNIITPMQLSEIRSQYYEPKYFYGNNFFALIIGDDIWDFLYFWNRNIILPSFRRKMISQLCLPLWAIESDEQRIAVRDFISRTFWPNGNSGVTVLLVSHEVNESTLIDIGSSLLKGSQLYREVKIIKPNTFASVQIGPIVKNLSISKHFQLIDSRSTLENVFPPFLDNAFISNSFVSKKWMLDFQIEYRPEKFSYINISYYWNLPKKLNISRYFINSIPGRITNGGWLSFEMNSNKKIIELNIPSDFSVISSYLIGCDTPYYTDDARKDFLKKKENEKVKKKIGKSDKGSYARGVIKKFPSLWHLGGFLENRFWRRVLEDLCHVTPETKEKLLEPIVNKINKVDSNNWIELSKKNKEKQKWLADFILTTAKKLHSKEAKISFNDLLERLTEERKEFKKSAQNPEQFDISEETNRGDLIDSLNSLVSKEVFEQGIEITCNYCGSTFWYGLEELKREVLCHGCQSILRVEVESPWIYKLNDLIRNAISFHGVFPVVWVLRKLLFITPLSFIYLPGVCLYEEYTSPSPYAEIDIACIENGKFAIGEIKTSADGFKDSDIKKLIKICKEIEPDEVIIGVFYDKEGKILKLAKKLQKELGPYGIEVKSLTPEEYVFDPSYHIVI
ncbi:MAG TPA: hypothetical protein VFD10_09060, partial [Atribacterota bacterium]|nr:hypothetical protein [Atribacterota bacterium]